MKSSSVARFLVLAFIASNAMAGTTQRDNATQSNMTAETEKFLSGLQAKFNLSADSTFGSAETSSAGDYVCKSFPQLISKKRVVGALAKICFSPVGKSISQDALLCDGDCSDKLATAALSRREILAIAEQGYKQNLNATVKASPETVVEEVWLGNEGVDQVRSGYVVNMDPYFAYIDAKTGQLVAYENRVWSYSAEATLFPRQDRVFLARLNP